MSLFEQSLRPAREAALVTGAGNGIGRAIAQALVGEGVRTVFADVNPDTVAEAIKTSPRPELASPFVGDLADRAVLRCAAGARAVGGRAGDAFRAQRVAAAARGRSRHGRQRRAWADARGQRRRRLSPRARTGAAADRGEGARLVPVPHLAACGHAAQPAALLDIKGGARHAGEGTGEDMGPLRHSRQRAGARRHRRRRFRRRSGVGKTHPARPPRPGHRPRADGAGGAVEQAVGLCHGRRHRDRRRAVADELVRAA